MANAIPKTLIWRRLPAKAREAALRRPALAGGRALGDSVAKIVAAVRKGGDRTVLKFTARFDKVKLASLRVTETEKKRALKKVAPDVKRAIERAAANIELFHQAQVNHPITVEVAPGLKCARRSVPIGRVGLYVPGGSASLPSTVLMLGIPARLAGCPTRILCSPPRPDGGLDPHVLYAGEVCGIGGYFRAGGAQAVAAMAFGTETIPKVDKIFGPGNAWVTEAKLQVARAPEGAALDMPAGPSEVMVIADETASAAFVAADLLSQAEHGPDSQVLLVATSASMLAAVGEALAEQLATLPRKEIAAKALASSLFIEAADLREAMEVANLYAPEHLILQVKDPKALALQVRNAGSVFLGAWAPESVGDYASGTNHVLPTYGYARSFSGVGVSAFTKEITFQELTPEALKAIGPTVETLAGIEGLHAHQRAVSLRLSYLAKQSRYDLLRKVRKAPTEETAP